MAKQNRLTLKKFFADGTRPTAENFGDLIDSTLNMKDEGFNKSAEHGFEISTTEKDKNALVSFFRDSDAMTPLWSIRFDDHDKHNLTFAPAESADAEPEVFGPALTLSPKGWVGVHTDSPACDLDVNGTMRCAARLGAVPKRLPDVDDHGKQSYTPIDESIPVLADGKWHNITDLLTGCQAFEVVAGVSKGKDKNGKNSGRYALLHAVALNAFNPTGWLFNCFGLKNRIKCRQSYYRRRSDKLVLRWCVLKPPHKNPSERHFALQIRSIVDYGKNQEGKSILIDYRITELWTDHEMKQSCDGGPDS